MRGGRLGDVDKLNPNDPRPPYLQVAEAFRRAIAEGRYGPGDKLPVHHAAADQYGVSVGTVKRAYTELQQASLIVTRQGQGSYVRSDGAANAGKAVEGSGDLDAQVRDLAARVAAIERQLAERQG